MTCDRYIDMIGRKLEGSLSASELEALTKHIADCPECRLELLLEEKIARALGQTPGAALPADFAERVSKRAFELARTEKRGRRWGYLIPVAANAVVVALAILYRADIAAGLAPVFGALGQAAGSLLHWAGSGSGGISGSARTMGLSGTYLLGTLGPLVSAFAVIIVASSRIYALRRR